MIDDRPEWPLIQVSVCMGTNCAFRGASHLIEMLSSEKDIMEFCKIEESPCLEKKCEHSRNSPVVIIDGDIYLRAKPEEILDVLHSRGQRIQEAQS
jgi:NADH:ubiquinone oxidoreductase subunit E